MITFLTKDIVLLFHKEQLKLYGGKTGLRDESLLESALAQAEASFGGEYVHKTIFEMAAAYGFHICQNHPFFDGNKRTALVSMYLFLYRNGYRINSDNKSLYALVMSLANGEISKDFLADYLKSNTIKLS